MRGRRLNQESNGMVRVVRPHTVDEIGDELPPGVISLAKRVGNLTVTLDGTEEQPEIGLISRVRSLEDDRKKLMGRLNLWGGLILGIMTANGLADGTVGKVIAGVLKVTSGG